jgi:hypothetical protein
MRRGVDRTLGVAIRWITTVQGLRTGARRLLGQRVACLATDLHFRGTHA